MTEIINRPNLKGISLYRDYGVQLEYDLHREHKHEIGDTSCDICRIVQEQKLAKGVLAPEIALPGISIVENTFSYRYHDNDNEDGDGFEIIRHHLIVPDGHYARLSDCPPKIKIGLMETVERALDSEFYDGVFVRASGSRGSSIDDHIHFHAKLSGRPVIERHFSRETGINVVRFAGDPPLQQL